MKEPHITRLMFHNVYGLSARGVEGFDMFAQEQHQLEVDIQCFSEHCLDTTKFEIYQTAQDILTRYFPGQSSLQLTSSTEPAINIYKPGGTGILVLGDLVSRQEPRGKGGDAMGRWSYLHLRRSHLPPLTIISAYQVCYRPTNLLGNTAFHQQQRALGATREPTIHPRQAFIQDLGKFVSSLQSKGHDIILGGDFNESLDDKHSGILKLITQHDLLDPFLHRFPHHPSFGTHVMGHKRIDSVFVTARVLSCLKTIGYGPFSYATTSDHRPILVELDTQSLFGQRTTPLRPPSSRHVKSNDKKAVSRFIENWYEMIQQNHGFDYIQQLDEDSAPPSIVEMIDELIGRCGDAAEKKCKRRRSEFYTCELVQQRLRVSILRGHLNALRMGADRSAQLKRKMHRAGMDFPLPETRRLTSQALSQAKVALRESSQKHSELRQSELVEKIEQASVARNSNKAKILRSIKKSEDNRRTFRILNAMKCKTNESQAIDRIEIPASWPPINQPIESASQLEDPKEATAWRTVTDPAELEYYLMMRNKLHFGQAEGTPFTQEPLVDEIDWTATSPLAESTLNGGYIVESSIPQCTDLLEACRAITPLDVLPAEITMPEFRAKIASWRENTTTSPSGRHLGRYKSLFAIGLPDPSSDQNGPQSESCSFSDKQKHIAAMIVSVLNYCIRNNYVLARWKRIVNVMIFKEIGNFQIHRLRVIHIYEADFNLLLAVKWRQLLRHADTQGIINEGQYGGRPGCEAQSLTLLEELKYDLSYLTRRTLFNFDNDAASCYDRIIVPLASLINRKYGLNRRVVTVHANTLRQAKFYLKTSAGISDTSYSHSQRFPIHGTGQGSGNSPSIWLFISSTLFDVHKSLSYGARFVSPDGNDRVSLSMVGFVDDSTGTCNDFQPQHESPLGELFQMMQYDAQLWNNLLFCSGGKLELKKCSFHVLHFRFKPDGTPVPVIDQYNDQIKIRDLATNEQVSIPSKRAFEPHKTLGHFKSPYSKPKRELDTIKTKASRLALLIGSSPLTRNGAFLAYNTVFIPSIAYSLPQSFFTRRELDQAQASSMHQIIAKCGYNRHTSRALLFAPKDYAGGGFLPWHMLQGEGQIKHFLKHWRTDSIISRTLRIALHWAQWQAGHPRPILEDPTASIPYLECRWLTSLRDFLATIQASIIVDQPFLAQPERHHDLYIMHYALESKLFTDRDMQIINYCRLYLHITTVSELFQPNGKTLIPDLFDCRREPWFNPATFVTLQRRPSIFQIRTRWQKLLRQLTSTSGELNPSIVLGSWTVHGHKLRRRRQTYLHLTTHSIYHWRGDSYSEYRPTHSQSQRFILIRSSTWTPTDNCTPISIMEQPDGSLYFSGDEWIDSPPSSSPQITRTFYHYIQTLQPWEQELLEGVELTLQPFEIRFQLSKLVANDSLLAVSDGSQRGSIVSFGWVIGTDQGIEFAEHSGVGTGSLTSHRAEAWGMLSASLFIYHVYQYTAGYAQQNTAPTPVTFMSDNNGLIIRLKKRQEYEVVYPNATLAPDWDLVEQIVEITKRTTWTQTTFQWIRGHQDEEDPDLSVAARYNIRADNLAGRAYPSRTGHDRAFIIVPAEKCTLTINLNPIHGHYSQAVRNAYTLPAFRDYLQSRYKWTPKQMQLIDWDIFRRAASNIHASQVQLLKVIHDKLPTNNELAKTNPFQGNKCHYCEERETFFHLCRCANAVSDKFRLDLIQAVHDYMETHAAPAVFQKQFMICLRQALDIPTSHASPTTTIGYHDELMLLGPRSILQGFWSQEWHRFYVHSTSYYTLETPSNTIDFLAGLIQILWKHQLQLWKSHLEHISSSDGLAPEQQEDKLQQYRTKIRLLHAQRNQCLHSHQAMYFHPDVDVFLQNATGTQMRAYLHHYEKAIQSSIDLAKSTPIRSIFTFPGFQHIRKVLQTNHIARHPSILHPPPDQQTIGHRPRFRNTMQGAEINRKHSRWKESLQFGRTLPSFFSSKPP